MQFQEELPSAHCIHIDEFSVNDLFVWKTNVNRYTYLIFSSIIRNIRDLILLDYFYSVDLCIAYNRHTQT
jgi:hypothetical protein